MRGVCDVIFAVNSRHVRLLGQPGLKLFFFLKRCVLCRLLCSLPSYKQLAERSAVDYTDCSGVVLFIPPILVPLYDIYTHFVLMNHLQLYN
jgi:hypothetical protein